MFGGFPYHRDIATNGDITSILTLESPALMEFVKPKEDIQDGFIQGYEHKHADSNIISNMEPITVLMEPQSLVLLSGEARWKCTTAKSLPEISSIKEFHINANLECPSYLE
jgi:hypothetical protein